MKKAAAIVLLAALSGGCTLVPRPEAAAEEVFRNARGEAVAVPFAWAQGVKSSEVEKLKSSDFQPFNHSTFQPFNAPEGGTP